MIAMLWGLLTSKLAGPVAAAGAAALAIALTVQMMVAGQVETDLRHQLKAATNGLLTCHENLASATGALAAQKGAMDALKAEGDQRTAAANLALQHARSQTAAASTRVASIMATPPPADQCAGIADLFNEGVK